MSKTILLIVRRHAGEIDWILPLLYKFGKNSKIFTVFANENVFKSIQNNKNLFSLWKKVCKNYYIEKKTNKFFWKIIFFFFDKLLKKVFFSPNFEKFLINKIFDINKSIFNKFSINEIDFIFIEHNNPVYLPVILKKKNNKTKIIRFPESTMFFGNKNDNPFFKQKRKIFNIYGDFFLFCSKNNADLYFEGQNSNFFKNKILYSNQLRYESWWKKKFFSYKKKNKYFNILIALRSYNNDYFHKESYYKTLKDLSLLVRDLKNIKLIFKIHPQEIDEKKLRNDLKIINKNFYSISKDHMISLSAKSDFCISILTSACFDSIIMKIPTVEYYNVSKEINLSPKAKEFMHLIYNKTHKKWSTIFEHNKVIKNISNYEELLNEIKKAKLNKKEYKKNVYSNYKRLVKLSNFGRNTENILKFLNKIN